MNHAKILNLLISSLLLLSSIGFANSLEVKDKNPCLSTDPALGDSAFWASKAVELYHEKFASRIVYESNQGKDLIPVLFKTIDENLPLRGVHASSAKIARAEPISALYEQGKVKHVRNPSDGASLIDLEVQMTTFEPMGRQKSPDRYDAMVWALTDLMLNGYAKPKLTLAYSSAKGLSR